LYPGSNVPAPLRDTSQPRELEPRESEVAEAPLPDSAEPVAEQRSSFSRRLSRSLDVDRASLFWVSEGSLHFRDREKKTLLFTGLSNHTTHSVKLCRVGSG
jgi:hypothetical protein